jgi:DNA-binding IclR family transcriptional regulator
MAAVTDQPPAAPSVLWKAFGVLGAFSHRDRVLSLAEIARRSALPKSTAHRVLAMLLETGAVEQTRSGYRLGLRMFSLGALPPEAELREAAMVHLEWLHRATGQTLHLAVLRGGDVVYLEKLLSRQCVDTPAAIGDRLPASCTAVGKALLAFSGEQAEASALARALPRLTTRSVRSEVALRGQLAAIRAQGFATDRQESTDGLACVAVPVIAGGHAVAAVSVAFPASAGTGSVFIGPLRQAAAAIASSPVIRRAAPLTDS